MVPNDVSTWARGHSHRDKFPGVVAAPGVSGECRNVISNASATATQPNQVADSPNTSGLADSRTETSFRAMSRPRYTSEGFPPVLTGFQKESKEEDVRYHPVYHIVEEPGGIRHLTECEVPTEYYNEARLKDLASRHPKCQCSVLEHLGNLEPFLDVSICAGFSYGVSKAFLVVMNGSLLGHKVGREGSAHDDEKTEHEASVKNDKGKKRKKNNNKKKNKKEKGGERGGEARKRREQGGK